MEGNERILWGLSLLEANGGGVKKSYFRDKCFAMTNLRYNGFYEFMSVLRGKEWIKEIEQKDGQIWVILTESGLEQLQALRMAK